MKTIIITAEPDKSKQTIRLLKLFDSEKSGIFVPFKAKTPKDSTQIKLFEFGSEEGLVQRKRHGVYLTTKGIKAWKEFYLDKVKTDPDKQKIANRIKKLKKEFNSLKETKEVKRYIEIKSLLSKANKELFSSKESV